MNGTTKNIVFLILSTIAGAAMMWWIYRGFDVHTLAEFFGQRSNYVWIILALAAGVLANVLRALRWRMLLESADIHISRRRSVELIFISYLINSVTPRLGELTRSLLVQRGNSAVSTRALGTVVVEKLADVGCLLVVIALAVSLRWQNTVDLVQRMSEGLTLALPSYTFYVVIGCVVCLLVGLSFPLWRHIRRFVGRHHRHFAFAQSPFVLHPLCRHLGVQFFATLPAPSLLRSPDPLKPRRPHPCVCRRQCRRVAAHPCRSRSLAFCHCQNPHHRVSHHQRRGPIVCPNFARTENSPRHATRRVGLCQLLPFGVDVVATRTLSRCPARSGTVAFL